MAGKKQSLMNSCKDLRMFTTQVSHKYPSAESYNCRWHRPSGAAVAPKAAAAGAPGSAAAAAQLSDGRWSCSQIRKHEN